MVLFETYLACDRLASGISYIKWLGWGGHSYSDHWMAGASWICQYMSRYGAAITSWRGISTVNGKYGGESLH
jgi:hypothetical protein